MTRVDVYDTTADKLRELADASDVTVAEVIDTLVEDYGEELEC